MKTLITALMLTTACCFGQTNEFNWTNNYAEILWTNSMICITNPTYEIAKVQGDPVTNIVILTNYSGTIQVGPNRYTVKELGGWRTPFEEGVNIGVLAAHLRTNRPVYDMDEIQTLARELKKFNDQFK